jgi:2,5-diamino-6-(ribosylamino)-4(3H)-pyrimidinone 5'-phosphate reductase
MLPRVILHNAVSADGRTTGLTANLGLFYELAARWQEDVTLAGCDTILAALRQRSSEAEADPPASDVATRGRLAVIDSRGRIKDWRSLKQWPFWSDFVAIGSEATPVAHLAYLRYQEVETITTGADKVDLAEALTEISTRYGARTVRVESGGTLNAALLRHGLVDEVSLLIHPVLIGGMSPHTVYRTMELAADTPIEMKLVECQLLDQTYAWLRYELIK